MDFLETDEVHIWCRWTDAASTGEIEQACEVLSADERAHLDRLRNPGDRRDYALAHELLRRSLSRYAAVTPERWEFVRGTNGKPRLDTDVFSFNLAHCRGFVACAVARVMPVGIDVERTDRFIEIEHIASQFFSVTEAASLRDARVDRRTLFFDLWTLKEAFVKAIGLGLSHSLGTFSFVLDDDESGIRFEAPPGYGSVDWHFGLYTPATSVKLAVAAHAPGHAVRWRAHEILFDGQSEMKPARTSMNK